jgi:thiosulfate dehydrogenase [quinone] large subunit
MGTRNLETDIFGQHVEFTYSETWIGYSLIALRVLIGWTFLLPGIRHAWDPNFSARGLLSFVARPDSGNPFHWLWEPMLDWVWLFTPLVSIGLIAIGLAVIFGVLFRFAAFWGHVMMAFFWAASLPLDNAYLVSYHTVYAFVLFGLGAFGAGRILGVDAYLEELEFVKERPWLRLLMG